MSKPQEELSMSVKEAKKKRNTLVIDDVHQTITFEVKGEQDDE